MDSKIIMLLDKKWEDLTADEIQYLTDAGVLNGCGGKGQKLLQYFFSKVTPYWDKACCRHHDFGYAKGGNEEDRKQCDLKFFSAMCEDWYKYVESKWKFTVYIFLCLVIYYLIRWQWSKYFNYRT